MNLREILKRTANKKTFSRAAIITLAGLSLLAGSWARAALPWSSLDNNNPTLAPMLEKVTPAVVNISTTGRVRIGRNPLLEDPFFRYFFGMPDQEQQTERKTESLGSGVIVDQSRGLIITNNHVIANADKIKVKLRDGRELEAKKIGADAETDIAVIQIPSRNLTSISMADSDRLRVGDFVVAIGNPFGLGQTVTSGIVSALGRSGLGIEGYEDFIQTDASINPGNSGGALVDLNGKLIGINTAIFSQSGGNIGIGFAIPINMAKKIMDQLVDKGEVKRGFLGTQLQDLDPELAEAFGISNQQGAVLVSIVPNSPADDAGLKQGDVVVAVNGKSVESAAMLRNQVGLLPIGSKVVLDIYRKGNFGSANRMTVTATIGENKSSYFKGSVGNERLKGVTFGDIPSNSPAYGQISGITVVSIERDSRAYISGLRKGDIIDGVNQMPVNNMQEFQDLVKQIDSALLFHVRRGDGAAFIVIR